MPKLTERDFTYYKEIITTDSKEHSRMLDVQNPDGIMDAYEGKLMQRTGDDFKLVGDMVENYILIATNTIIPTLFYQVPRPLIRGHRDELKYSAAVLNGLVKAYFTDKWKSEIQSCIIDAFLPYPFGVMKVGYNSRVGKVPQGPSLLTGQTSATPSGTNLEASQEYLQYERPFIERHSPRYTYLDSTKEFGKGTRVTFEYDRTLQEMVDSNLYSLSSDFINYFKTRDGDNRKVKIKVKEHFCLINNVVWKLVYTEDWHDELYWDKTTYTKLPYELLRFNKLADRVYTTSHGREAYSAQKELNYYNELWKKHIDGIRRQHLIWSEALTESGRKTLKANETDAIVETDKPITAGVYQQIVSEAMGKDVYAGIDNVRNYLKLLLSTSGGRGGETEAEFAYTEKQQAVGDYMRMSGLQDEIRTFVRGILGKTVKNIIDFGDPQVTIQITGKDVRDPITGEIITGREMQFGGPNGLQLQDEVKGDIETEYTYDIDIMSASKPDFGVIRKQMAEFLTVVMNPAIEVKMAQEGKRFNVSEFVQDFANTFETLADPQKYISDMSDEEKMALAMQAQAAQGGQSVQGAEMGGQGVQGAVMEGPTDESMAQGLEQSVQGGV